jgi:hypothetical protein
MKNLPRVIFLAAAACFLQMSIIHAQVPQALNYQAVARDAAGAVLASQNIALRLTITDGNGGATVYRETHSTTTNQFGLFTLKAGNGTVQVGTFVNIAWAYITPWLKVEMDPAGGTSYTDMGSSQLLSAPYALFAEESRDNVWVESGANIYNANTGNVGIGLTVPTVKLDVSESDPGIVAKFNSANQVYIGLYEGNVYRGYVGSYFGNAADIDVGSQAGAVHLVTNSLINLTADAGNVGIGTTTPSAKLDIDNSAIGQTLRLNAPSDVFLGFWEGGGYRGHVGSYYGALNDVDLGSLVGSVHLVTGSTIDLTANAGNIGIGTTTPLVDLHIVHPATWDALMRVTTSGGNHDAGIELERLASGTQWRIVNMGSSNGVAGNLVFQSSPLNFGNVTDRYEFNPGYFRPTVDNDITLGQSTHRWIDVWAADGTINTSDARDKTNIKNLQYGLDEILKLRPVTYQWAGKEENGNKVGLIAQELQQVLPEVVRDWEYDINPETNERMKVSSSRLGVFYADIIPVLVKSIQEQQKIIEDQGARIKALEKK